MQIGWRIKRPLFRFVMKLLFAIISATENCNVIKSNSILCWIDTEKSIGPSSNVGCWKSVGTCLCPTFGKIIVLVLCIPPCSLCLVHTCSYACNAMYLQSVSKHLQPDSVLVYNICLYVYALLLLAFLMHWRLVDYHLFLRHFQRLFELCLYKVVFTFRLCDALVILFVGIPKIWMPLQAKVLVKDRKNLLWIQFFG